MMAPLLTRKLPDVSFLVNYFGSTVRYLSVEVDYPLIIAEQVYVRFLGQGGYALPSSHGQDRAIS
jgi:hypothetical protein